MPYCGITANAQAGEENHRIHYETFGNGPNKIIFLMGLGGEFLFLLLFRRLIELWPGILFVAGGGMRRLKPIH
jgi:hypothetical protein